MHYLKLRAGQKSFTFNGMVFVPNKILQVTQGQIIALQNEYGEGFQKLFAIFVETSLFKSEKTKPDQCRLIGQLSAPFRGENKRGYNAFEQCINRLLEQNRDLVLNAEFQQELLMACRSKGSGINARLIKDYTKKQGVFTNGRDKIS